MDECAGQARPSWRSRATCLTLSRLERSASPRAARAGLARPGAGQRLVELQRELHLRLGALLLARSGEIRHPDPKLAVAFVLEQLRAMLLVRLEGAHLYSSLTAVRDARFIREALKSVAAYLQLDSGRKAR